VRVAELRKAGAFGIFIDAGLETDGAHGIERTPGRTGNNSHGATFILVDLRGKARTLDDASSRV
jgi:hypothetical protein